MNLRKKYITYALSSPCPAMIPRSGEKGALVNCYTVAIDKDAEPHYLVREIQGDELTCSEWNGSKYEIERKIKLSSVNPKDFRISHYYGLSEVTYFGITDFIVGRIFFIEYIKIHGYRVLTAADQYIFNKKKLVTKQRIDLLRFLVSQALEGKKEFDVISLMTKLYTIKWVLHPDKDSQIQKVKLYLKSLVDTGELQMMNGNYVLTGHALRGIEEYEEQERKHIESVKIQRRMFWLTMVIALLTLVQAGLVKLPPIIDATEYISERE
ncbi:hypothetical protein [Flavihumibacter sp.]|uniref:hypothetical protein n=1 Tax=Flavihumibacter sp. TaxID=1913981 RepID=UPI002FCC1205